MDKFYLKTPIKLLLLIVPANIQKPVDKSHKKRPE
jgi:hypothetical protein